MANHLHKTPGLKTFKAYMVGLGLCLILTLLAFYFTARAILPANELVMLIMFLAVVQFIVQTSCFLRLNNSREGRWELMPFLFTIFVVLVLVLGSMWIMFNLNYFMMN